MFRWRRIYLDWRLFLFYPVVVVLPSSFLYSFATGPRPSTVWQDLLVSFLVLTMTLWLWRVAREGIYTNDQGVRIQHLIRRTELAWSDVVRVYDARPAGVIAFRTTNGQTILSPVQWMGAVYGKSYSPVMRRAAYDRLIERLNAQHATATQSAPATESRRRRSRSIRPHPATARLRRSTPSSQREASTASHPRKLSSRKCHAFVRRHPQVAAVERFPNREVLTSLLPICSHP